MENKEEDLVKLDAENEADNRFDAYSYPPYTYGCYRPPAAPRIRSTSESAVEKDSADPDDVICIGSTIRGASNYYSPMSRVDQRNAVKKRVTFADDVDKEQEEEENDDIRIEWIASKPPNVQTRPPWPYVDGGEPNVIDVEREFLADLDSHSHSVDRGSSSTVVVSAIVHDAPSSSSSAAASLHDDSVQESEIDDYDARMRACFGLDLDFSISSVKTEGSASDLDRSRTDDDSADVSTSTSGIECGKMECDDGDESTNGNTSIFDVEDDSEEDDCVITSMEISGAGSDSDTKPHSSCAADDDDKDDVKIKVKCKKKKNDIVSETTDEIFKRMMPSAVPGVLSLFAPDRHCLPRNVRPSKFCYYYFVSSHIVVKEIAKPEFYKFKDQILVARKSNAPPRCNCLTHPLNQNASKLTLLTNPYSLFHKPSCHFAAQSKNSPAKRKGPRRLSYMVSFHQVPRKREGKDFKDWSDIVIRRRQNASSSSSPSCDRVSSSANWCNDDDGGGDHRPQNKDLVVPSSSFCKIEPTD